MIDILLFTALYSVLVMIVAGYYHKQGYNKGVFETVESIRMFEEEAVTRAILKIKQANDRNDK